MISIEGELSLDTFFTNFLIRSDYGELALGEAILLMKRFDGDGINEEAVLELKLIDLLDGPFVSSSMTKLCKWVSLVGLGDALLLLNSLA